MIDVTQYSDLETLLDEAYQFVSRYIAADPSHKRAALCYAVATWAMDVLRTMGRILIVSPDPESGKTTFMNVIMSLCCNPEDVTGTTYALRSLLAEAENSDDPRPTCGYDEIQGRYGEAGISTSKDDPFDIVIKKGYKRNATMRWSVGRVSKKFSTFTAWVMTGLRVAVPYDIRTRCIVIKMQAGTPEEYFSVRNGEREAEELAAAIGSRVRDEEVLAFIKDFDATGLHPKLYNRKLEVWEPPIAVATALGGLRWQEYMLQAFEEIALSGREVVLSPRERTLMDLEYVVDEVFDDVDFAGGEHLAKALQILEDMGSIPGNRYRHRSWIGVAKMVANAMPVRSEQIRFGDGRVKGYFTDDIRKAARRANPERENEEDERMLREETNPFEVTDMEEHDGYYHQPGHSRTPARSGNGQGYRDGNRDSHADGYDAPVGRGFRKNGTGNLVSGFVKGGNGGKVSFVPPFGS